ncbi:MAG: DUF4154 domain-containing protein [Archangiaceae bacterium]|nr:DUF4154 domain-containing protein [Archangiaceae bacterium]
MARKLRWLTPLVLGLALGSAHAEETTMPAPLQASLLARAAMYDKNFGRRAGEHAKILLISSGSPASTQFFGQLKEALSGESLVGGKSHDEELVPFSGAAALAAKVKSDHPAVVFLGPGLQEADVKAVVAALSGLDVLTASANPAWVAAGVSLGFDLVSGKPRLLVNLKQAQKQSVAFGADFLRLAQVVDP